MILGIEKKKEKDKNNLSFTLDTDKYLFCSFVLNIKNESSIV
jgi:hypothetical protein